MLRIPTRLQAMVPSPVRARGQVYFARGAVRLERAEPRRIEAQVHGSASYQVELRRVEKEILYSCACRYFECEVAFCKHLWATLLAASGRVDLGPWAARGVDWYAKGDPAGAEGDEGDNALAADDWLDDDEEEPEDDGLAALRPFAVAPAPASWRRLMSELEQSAVERARLQAEAKGVGQRELLYLLERNRVAGRGRLQLCCEVRIAGRDGEWRAPKPLRLTREQLALLEAPEDRALLGLLAGPVPASDFNYGYADSYRARESIATRFELEGHLLELLAPRLAATGRFRVRATGADGKGELGPPIAWRPEPLRIQLRLRPVAELAGEAPTGYRIEPVLVQGESLLAHDATLWFVRGGVVVGRDWAAPLDDAGAFELLGAEGAITVPTDEIDDWLAAIHRLPHLPPLELPPELELAELSAPPVCQLEIAAPERRAAWVRRERLAATLGFRYGRQRIAAADPRQVLLEVESRRRWRRDRVAEAAAAARLDQLGVRSPPSFRAGDPLELLPKSLPGVVRTLVAEGWEVEAQGRFVRPHGRASFALSSGIDWFELAGSVDFGGESAQLPALLAALRSGAGIVELGDGSFGLLPEEWLERHALLGEIGQRRGDKIRFSGAQAALIDSWLGEESEVETDAEFEKLRRELAGFAGIAPADPPDAFHGQLRDYQREGLGWLRFLQRFGLGGCLADDMGLGKTVQLLALLAGRQRGAASGELEPLPTLVVVPRSLLFNWRQEAARFAPALSVHEHHGAGRAKEPAELARHDLVLTTYGTLRSDIELLAATRFDYCILDEAQAIKNAKTAAAKAARRIRARHRLVATGTPVENHLGELWSLLEFLNPGLLGRSSLFRTTTGAPRKLPEATRRRLARALRPYVLRRTKAEVAPELPAKTEQTLLCELEGAQRKLYDELRDHYRRSLAARVARQGWAKSKIQVLEALLRLRQAACHPGLLDPRRALDASAKFEALLPRLDELREEGHKTLVFSQFTSLLALLKRRLDARRWTYEYLDGATVDRQRCVERFQNDDRCPLFLISLKAGGFGLNLTAAEYVFLLDPWWNPAVEAQAIDRTHRIGQTRAVFAYRLIAQGTVEERIVELQAQKRELADALLGGDQAPLADLGREDLDLLLA